MDKKLTRVNGREVLAAWDEEHSKMLVDKL